MKRLAATTPQWVSCGKGVVLIATQLIFIRSARHSGWYDLNYGLASNTLQSGGRGQGGGKCCFCSVVDMAYFCKTLQQCVWVCVIVLNFKYYTVHAKRKRCIFVSVYACSQCCFITSSATSAMFPWQTGPNRSALGLDFQVFFPRVQPLLLTFLLLYRYLLFIVRL
jgi:hypothetical protein